MEDRKKLVCPRCGRELLFRDQVCPFCGGEIAPGMAEAEAVRKKLQDMDTSYGQEADPVFRREKMAMRLSLGTVAIVMAVTFVLGMVSMTKQNQVLREREKLFQELEPLASQPKIDLQHQQTSQEELDALDELAPWRDPELIRRQNPDLTETELEALDLMSEELLPKGRSRKVCVEEMMEIRCTREEAEHILDLCQVNFETQALKQLLRDLNFDSSSLKEARSSLDYWGYTPEEADYALENCGTDWNYQAELAVRSSLQYLSISEEKLQNTMVSCGHDPEQVAQIIDWLDPDWNREALQEAMELFRRDPEKYTTRQDMIRELQLQGFTDEQCQYAAELVIAE